MNETQLIVEFWHLAVAGASVLAAYFPYHMWRSGQRKEEAARRKRWNDAAEWVASSKAAKKEESAKRKRWNDTADAHDRLTKRFDIDEYVKHRTKVELHLAQYPNFKEWVTADIKALNKHKARAEAQENGAVRRHRED